MNTFDSLKVFSASLYRDREVLGERITDWIAANDVEISRFEVRQSSDRAFHCLTIIVFYRQASKPNAAAGGVRG
jgi:hypothetical protein